MFFKLPMVSTATELVSNDRFHWKCVSGRVSEGFVLKTYPRFQVTLWATEIKKISLVSRSWSTVWINMQKMSNGDYFDEKMRRGDRSKEARRISPPLKLLLKSPKLRGSTAPKSAHLHRGREQGAINRAPNEPAMVRNANFGLYLVVFEQKILFFLEKSKVLLPT